MHTLGRRSLHVRDSPLAEPVLAVESRQQARVGGDGHGSRFAWLQVNALELEQPHVPAVPRAGEIDLRHVRARST